MQNRDEQQHHAPTEDVLVEAAALALGLEAADATAMLEAIGRGESRADYFGFTPEVLNSLEAMALGYYRGQRYSDARRIFRLLVDMSEGRRASAWRGLGACDQAEGHHAAAVEAYRQATGLNPDDAIASVHLGECLCLLGEREAGLAVLRPVIKGAKGRAVRARHITHARSIVAAGGGIAAPPRPAQSTTAEAGAPQGRLSPSAAAAGPAAATPGVAAEAGTGAGDEGWQNAEARARYTDPTVQALLDDPATRAKLDVLADAVHTGQLTLRRIADISQEQMDAGYAIACQYLERGEPLKAVELAGWMLWIDSHDTRFMRLSGLCMHHLKLWCLADYLYALVDVWREGGADPATKMYRGEVKILLDERDEGRRLLEEGLAEAGPDAALQAIVRRSQALLQQLAQAG